MGCDHGDSIPFDLELNGIPFGSKSKGKLSPRLYPIQFERKWNTSFLSADFVAVNDRIATVKFVIRLTSPCSNPLHGI